MQGQELKQSLIEWIAEEKMHETEADPVYGNGGAVTIRPTAEEEIIAIVQYANQNGKKIIIEGGGTKKGFGGLAASADICLSLADYTGIIEHVPGDMTITVKAGTPFKEVQRYLAGFNQMVAMDPFAGDQSTIGGIVAANDSGPKRLGYGAARDSVIGMRLVYPDGKVIRAGGKVVKNVAGYDMNKLFIGSMGTLAVMTEISLKLRPIAKYASTAIIRIPDPTLEAMKQFAVRLLDSTVEPVAFEVLSPSLALKLTGKEAYTFVVAFEDVESSVLYQEQFTQNLAPDGTEIDFLRGDDHRLFWNAFYATYPHIHQGNEGMVLKFGSKNMDVLKLILASEKAEVNSGVEILAHGGLGHGIGQFIVNGESQKARVAAAELRKEAVSLGGYAIVRQAPYKERLQFNPWGETPAYQFLLQGIKDKIDPNRVLNDKRFVGGI